MEKKELLYEGKAKKLYKTEDNNLLIAEFKDDLTAFNALKKGSEDGKGALNNKISTQLFKILEKKGIKTHLVNTLDETHQLVKFCKIIPIEVIVRNIATGSLTKRLGITDGTTLPFPLVEFCYKNDDLGDPLLNDEHCLILNLVQDEGVLVTLKELARKINSILKDFFAKRDLILVDFKVEFGIDSSGEI